MLEPIWNCSHIEEVEIVWEETLGRSAGLFVQTVAPGGPADEAGLRPGDVIVAIDGEPAESVDASIVKTLKMDEGDVIHLTYERQGASHTTSLRLAAG